MWDVQEASYQRSTLYSPENKSSSARIVLVSMSHVNMIIEIIGKALVLKEELALWSQIV